MLTVTASKLFQSIVVLGGGNSAISLYWCSWRVHRKALIFFSWSDCEQLFCAVAVLLKAQSYLPFRCDWGEKITCRDGDCGDQPSDRFEEEVQTLFSSLMQWFWRVRSFSTRVFVECPPPRVLM